jgi:thiol-disulfide isomerase/thioredoxin
MAQKGTTKPATSKGKPTTQKPANVPPAAPSATVQIGKPDYKNVGRLPGNYAIKVKLKGFKNTNIFLADNFGDKQYFRDTCMLDANGVGTFIGGPKLQRGMYMIVFPELNGYYELPITDDQTFYFEGDTSMDETKIVVTGSPENEAFVTYQKNRAINGRMRYDLDNQIKSAAAAGNTELKTALTVEKDSLDKRDLRYRESYMTQNPNHLLTKIFKAFQNVKIPDNPNPKDSMFEYNYFRNHYWDNVDFNESGLIRAPQGLLTLKLNDYIDKVTFQDYDSLTKAVDIVIGKTVPYTEIQKYFVQYLTNKFQDRKIMCQDNVTIHLINKYYCTGDAWWYDDTAGKRKMCEEAKRAIPTMCGRIAPDLNLADTAGKYHRLYENMGKFTIVFFYDPTCGHCKEVIPVVNQVFQKHKNNGIKVYAVSSEGKYNEWMKMMRERPELHAWMNVCKTNQYYPWPYNRYDYNIQANPTIIIIDEQGKILGKKIDEHQLEFFLESLMFEKGLIKTKPTPPSEKVEEKKEG